MENQECEIEELPFQPGNEHQTRKERKILQFFSRFDNDKQRKTKLQFFNRESIEGLLTVFQINHNRMDFITEQQLITQLNIFMSNGKKINYKMYEQFNVKFNQFYILFQGCLLKKQDHQSTTNHSFIPQVNRRSRPSSRKASWMGFDEGMLKGSNGLMHTAMNIKNVEYQHKTISSNHELSPRTIYYDPLDKRPYECKSNCTLFQFPKVCLQKFQNWMELKEKEGLVNFMSVCFGVEDQKGLSKLIQKIVRVKRNIKQNIAVEAYTIYLIHVGQVLVKTKYYNIHLNKNSIIYKDQHFEGFQAQTKNLQTSLISISLFAVIQLLQESFPNLLQGIKKKLNSLHNERLQLLSRAEMHIQQPIPMQPIFNTRILNIKAFEKQRKYEWLNQIEDKNENHKFFVTTPKVVNVNSSRFRIDPNANKQNMIQSDFAIFMSNYPYQKLVQSEVKLNQNIRRPISNFTKKCPFVYEAITEQQRKRVEREKKKIYYMNKVRKLKIKNIVEKEIPNFHKNKYDVEAAEREMHNNSLFSNIIEYPMNGISQGAKESISKNMSKMIKIAESNSKAKTVERKNLSESNAKDDDDGTKKHSLKSFSLQNDSNFDESSSERENIICSNQKFKLKRDSNSDSEIQNQLKTVAFLFGNNFSPHLPTQKDIKCRALKTFHNFIDNEKRTNFHLKTEISKKSIRRNEAISLEKPQCILLTLPSTVQHIK